MKPVIVADTSPLIALAKLEQLDLLSQAFSSVHVPRTVLNEATRDMQRPDAQAIQAFVSQQAQLHEDSNDAFCVQLRHTLDEGEVQALNLASQLQCAVLIDEQLGRQVAQSYQIPVVGVLGVLLKGKQSGAIEAIAPLLSALQAQGYRLSAALVEKVVQAAGEA